MKIYLDNIVFSLQGAGGISVYWYELIKRLDKTKNDVKYIENSSCMNNIFRKDLKIENIVSESESYKVSRYLPVKIDDNEKFIFHSSYYRYCKNKNAINVVTVHDFTYEYYCKGIKKFINYYQKKIAIKHADAILCVSENTKKDLLKIHPWCKDKVIEVVYNGVSEEFKEVQNSDVNTTEFSSFINEKYILFVGARAGYKNFEFAIDVMTKLEKDYKLIIVGGGELTYDEKQVLEEKLKDRYLHVGRIESDKLTALYNNAHCLLYPSLYEGFGIPVAEASMCGCKVVALNRSSIPEVADENTIMLNECDLELFVEAIKNIDNSNRNYIKSKFNWDKTFYGIMDVYETVYEKK